MRRPINVLDVGMGMFAAIYFAVVVVNRVARTRIHEAPLYQLAVIDPSDRSE